MQLTHPVNGNPRPRPFDTRQSGYGQIESIYRIVQTPTLRIEQWVKKHLPFGNLF
jgi:hypothetical protein